MSVRSAGLRRPVLCVGCVLTVWLAAAPLRAQSNNDRRQFFDNLVRGLVDSRLQDAEKTNATRDFGPSRAPAAALAGARPLIETIAADASRLTDAVYAEATRLPALRSYLNNVLQLRAQALVLADQVQRQANIDQIRNDVGVLDGQWRVLRGQLLQVDGLSQNARAVIERLQSTEDQLLRVLDIRPQLDAAEVLRILAGLSASVDHLAEDLELEIPPSNSRTQLLRDARLVRDQVNYVARAVQNRVETATVVQEYRRFRDNWYSLAARIRPLQNRYLDRHVRRIERMDREARELLWISDTIDQTQVLSLALSLNRDVDRLYEQLSVNDLLKRGAQSRELLDAAGELQARSNQLIRSFDGEMSRPELNEVMGRIQASWTQLDSALSASVNSNARNLMGEIRETIGVIATAIGMRGSYDRRRLEQLAASSENLADHLLYEVTLYLRTAARPPADLLPAATRLRDQARVFHRAVVNGADPTELRQQNELLTQSWNRLRNAMTLVPPRDRQQMAGIGADLTPGLIELQTMLAL